MKVSELQGAALDWVVAKAEGFTANQAWTHGKVALWKGKACKYSPSTDWSQGGPIIEREYIQLEIDLAWVATRIEGSSVSEEHGPTPLIAAMRCYVASRLGDEVTIPEELK